jgi:ribosomal protein S10
MTQIHVTIKSFQWYQIKNTILFIKKIQFLLNYRSMTNPPTKIEKQSNTVTSSVALQRKKQRKNRRCKINKMSFTSFPKKRKLFTVLRSPHIDKKSREQFQFVFHKLKLVLNGKNDNKTNLFIFLLKNSEFPGVEMEIILNYHSCLHCL